MELIKHNVFGVGEVIERSEKANGAVLTVRYESGRISKLEIPTSFKDGLFEVEGALAEEIARAIAEEKRIAAEKRAAFLAEGEARDHATKSTGTRAKKAVTSITRGEIESGYEEYLIKAGYKQETDNGDPSTVYSYIYAIERNVLDEEGISWEVLKRTIDTVIERYGEGGVKEHIGAKSNSTVINALRRFKEYTEI